MENVEKGFFFSKNIDDRRLINLVKNAPFDEVEKALLERGEMIEQVKDAKGYPIIFSAIYCNRADIVELLLLFVDTR